MTPADSTCARATRDQLVGRLERADSQALRAESLDTLMLNVTLRCDLACAHCHQSCSPQRHEQMSRETMESALDLARMTRPSLIDVTGGEPVLWPHLRDLIARASDLGLPVRVRTNLVALGHPDAAHLPAFFASHRVALLGSLPGTSAEETAEQRGPAAFEAAVQVLRKLAALGYGSGDGLVLDLAYNPPLGQAAGSEARLAARFRETLVPLGVRFDALYSIANVPVGRYGRRLQVEGGLEDYLACLASAFNPDVAAALTCRHGLTVGWDGTLSDCDFNLAAGLGLAEGPATLAAALAHIAAEQSDAPDAPVPTLRTLASRRIAFGRHCFACTAGAGSG